MFGKKSSKILKLPPVHNCFTLAMTNKLVVIINSFKVPQIKKILLYEMKFLVPNYSCLQNPWLGGYCPQIRLLSVLNWMCKTPPPRRTKFLGTPPLQTTRNIQQCIWWQCLWHNQPQDKSSWLAGHKICYNFSWLTLVFSSFRPSWTRYILSVHSNSLPPHETAATFSFKSGV